MNARSQIRSSCLVTNDDGIKSEGLRQLAIAATQSDFDVVVAAPHQESSGSSAALSAVPADGKIMMSRTELAGLSGIHTVAVDAAPAFIVFTALHRAFGPVPELVVSGINRGPNTGRAVLHSGTVGAAMTAAIYGMRTAAFSLDWRDGAQTHWDTAAAVAAELLPGLRSQRPGVVLNVNVPNVPRSELRGIRPASLAATGAVQLQILATARDYVQVAVHESAERLSDGSDAALVAAGFACVTQLLPLCEV